MSSFKQNLGFCCCYLVLALLLVVPACEKSAELGDNAENLGDAEIGVVRSALSSSELDPVADSTIQSQHPFENNGDSSLLEVTAASAFAIERTLVRFDQTAIEQAVDGQQVTSATLQVTINGLSMGWDGGPIAAHRMLMPWTEDGVTWACANDTWTGGIGDLFNNCSVADTWGMDWWSLLPQPYEETPSATTAIHAFQTGTISFDVTTDVQSFLAGASNYGWMIAGTEDLWSGLWVDFHSRETWYASKLILEYGPALPTASVSVDVTNDTFVSQWFPNRNRDGETLLKANSDVSTFTKHALVQFSDYDISEAMAEQAVGSGYELKSAKLIMTVKDPWPFSLMNLGDLVNVHRMLQPWVVDSVTWECSEDANPDNEYKDCSGTADWDMLAPDPNNRPYLPTATDGQIAEVTYGAEMVWDVTADVAGFRDGTFENYGWLFSKPDDPWLGFISFFSEEGGIPGRLELEFEYRDCTVDQPCGSGQGSCESDDECEPGLVCEFGIEDRFEQPEGVGICWDPECRTDPRAVGCGWRGDPCGICPCVPDCTNKTCGSDGCGGTCNDYCDIGDSCVLDIDCGNNQVCDVIDSSNSRACVPSSCTNGIHDLDETDRDCGGDCMPCSEACTKQFCRSGEQINPDPLATLSFSIGDFTRDSYAVYQTEKGTEFARPNELRYEDRNDGNGRVAVFQGAEDEREADVLVFESSVMPSWMRSGTWQFDVYPYYSSEELAASTGERVLFSFNSSNDRIVLRPVSGSARLAVITGGITRHERALAWSAHQKMTITLDTWGGDITVLGASGNNGEQHVFPFFFSSGRLRVGGLLDDAKEANARISEPRRVSQSSITCTPDANFCTADCPCKSGEGNCTDDTQCETGLACHTGVGEAHGLPSSYGVCRMPLCNDPSDPRFVCGSADASCGICPPCTPDCTNKSCGSNGCWGSCGEECEPGESGCGSNADCAQGSVCGVGNGERFGYGPDVRVCWPAICERLDQMGIPCGDTSAACGLCPVCDAEANCAGRTCGPDGCGGSCGSVEEEQYCDVQTGIVESRQYLSASRVPIVPVPVPYSVRVQVE